MIAFFAEWAFLLVAAVFLVPAFVFIDKKHFGRSTSCMMVSVGLVGWFFWPQLSALIASRGLVNTIIYASVVYVLAALVTSFIYWMFFNWKAKERFERFLAETPATLRSSDCNDPCCGKNPPQPELFMPYRKYVALDKNTHEIFDDFGHELKIDLKDVRIRSTDILQGSVGPSAYENGVTITQEMEDQRIATNVSRIVVELEAAVAEVLPPRFKVCKSFIVGAGIDWPITLIWLLLSRFIKQLIERLVSVFHKSFDALGRLTFGKI